MTSDERADAWVWRMEQVIVAAIVDHLLARAREARRRTERR